MTITVATIGDLATELVLLANTAGMQTAALDEAAKPLIERLIAEQLIPYQYDNCFVEWQGAWDHDLICIFNGGSDPEGAANVYKDGRIDLF